VNGSLITDRYRVEGVLSHGGMGTVLEATQVGIDRPVVVKILRDSRPEDRGRVRRFYREARLISALDHPNIVRIFEFGLDPVFRVPFIAMEKVEGITLQQLMQREGALSERRAARLFVQIVRALIEAHRKGVLHRDLKPRNVMVRRLPEGGEHLTVLDFGLAKFIEDEQLGPPLTAPGRTVGTPGYMSPEQVLGRPLDFRSDLYGLGCMLHATLAGRPPFEGSAALSVMRKQVREPPPPLPERLSGGAAPSPQLRALVSRLLAKEPDDRPRTLDDVLEAFERMSRSSSWIDDATTRVEVVRPEPVPTSASDQLSGDHDVEAGIVTARTPQARPDASDEMATIRVPPTLPPARGHEAPAPPAAAPTPEDASDVDTFRDAFGSRRSWVWGVLILALAVGLGLAAMWM
jgi:serine/threonine-protein kinase